MSQLLLLLVVLLSVIVLGGALAAGVWFLPDRYRPWIVAALLVGATGLLPRSSFVPYVVAMTILVVIAALVLTWRTPDSLPPFDVRAVLRTLKMLMGGALFVVALIVLDLLTRTPPGPTRPYVAKWWSWREPPALHIDSVHPIPPPKETTP